MNFYKRHLGDYAKKAGRLTMLQHGAYNQLIDACYDREEFPTEDQAIEWCWASTTDEEQAVKFVLKRFFKRQADGIYIQNRIATELELYRILAVRNRLIALERETKKAGRQNVAAEYAALRDEIKNDPLSKTHATWTSLVDALVDKHALPPNHKPLTTNHKPLTTNQIINTPPNPPQGGGGQAGKKSSGGAQGKAKPTERSPLLARFDRFWATYPKKKSKFSAEKAWLKIKPGEQLTQTILSAVERAKTSEDWLKNRGQYIPNPATWLNGGGWHDEQTEPSKPASASKSCDGASGDQNGDGTEDGWFDDPEIQRAIERATEDSESDL